MNPKSYRLSQLFWFGVYAVGMAVMLAFWWNISGHKTNSDWYSIELALGHVTGLIGTYCVIWQVLLMSRLVPLEDAFGLERVDWLHKWNGYTALTLLLLHTYFLIDAYAIIDKLGFIAQFVDFNVNWEDMLKATLGMTLLTTIVFISIGIVRLRLKYETWFYVHLFVYLAILLAFSHQLSVGADFIGQPAFVAYWWTLYAFATSAIVFFRVGQPVYLLWRHRTRIDRIVHETPDIVSIYVTGRHLDELKYRPGQFMIWRFLTNRHWAQGHPFTISVAPNGQYLRLTAKQVGDFTKSLDLLVPGDWVLLDGPHGHFTPEQLSNPKLLLIAGGSGITPIRSMLEQLPSGVQDVVVLYAARTQADLALRSELETLITRYHGTIRYVLSNETAPGFTTGVLDDANLRALVPDAASREVMLCGPPGMMKAVAKTLHAQGVKTIHTERFAFSAKYSDSGRA